MERLRIEKLYLHNLGPLNCTVAARECLGLTGPSGIGKTLFLRALADMDPHTGAVLLDGIASSAMTGPQWRRKVGLLASESTWWYDTVGEHFAKMEEHDYESVGFDGDVASWAVSRLSSGERQRLALLRLLAGRPAVLLLDEPTANLDAQNTILVEKFIRDYRLAMGAAVVWVTHDRRQLKRAAGRRLRLTPGGLENL